jgi:hypothetical protein
MLVYTFILAGTRQRVFLHGYNRISENGEPISEFDHGNSLPHATFAGRYPGYHAGSPYPNWFLSSIL